MTLPMMTSVERAITKAWNHGAYPKTCKPVDAHGLARFIGEKLRDMPLNSSNVKKRCQLEGIIRNMKPAEKALALAYANNPRGWEAV